MHWRLEIDGDLLAGALPFSIVERVGEPNAAALDPRVVDQHVEPWKLGDRPSEQREAAGRSFDIADVDRDLAVRVLRFPEFVLPAAADNHVASRVKKTLGERKADS